MNSFVVPCSATSFPGHRLNKLLGNGLQHHVRNAVFQMGRRDSSRERMRRRAPCPKNIVQAPCLLRPDIQNQGPFPLPFPKSIVQDTSVNTESLGCIKKQQEQKQQQEPPAARY